MYYHYFIFVIIIFISLINLFIYPIFNTHINKNKDNIDDIIYKRELFKTDKIIDSLTNNTGTNNLPNNINNSIYKINNLIDDNDCYEPNFRICNRKLQKNGYEIFTPVQKGCLYPDDKLDYYNTAYAQVDKYLNLLPPATGERNNMSINERKKLCISKPNVKNGLNKFNLCDRDKLQSRCKLFKEQSNYDKKKKDESNFINNGINNMKLIYSSCFTDDEPLKC